MRVVRTVSLCATWVCASSVSAVQVNLSYLEGTQPVALDAITKLGPDLFDDKVNLFNGAPAFQQSDTSLPGKGKPTRQRATQDTRAIHGLTEATSAKFWEET